MKLLIIIVLVELRILNRNLFFLLEGRKIYFLRILYFWSWREIVLLLINEFSMINYCLIRI